MSKIVERANEFANDFSANDSPVIANLIHHVARDGYIKGATEQRDIDLVRALNFLRESTPGNFSCFEELEYYFCKAMRDETDE